MKEYRWLNSWTSENQVHLNSKKEIFERLSKYTGPIKTMLDIGCGLAREAEFYQKKYGTTLYLLDGDFNTTKEQPRDTNYGSISNFKFYSPIEELKKSYNERGLRYNFIDANNIFIEKSIKFNLIYSCVSCGFHYPASTYKELILNHINSDSKIIFDIRKKSTQTDIKIKNILHESKKFITAEIEFI